jgi:hypothetical protein
VTARPTRLVAGIVSVALATLAAAPGAAWGDADPASDYLPGFDSYLPYGNTVAKPTQRQLDRLLKIARARGHPFKVAVIATPTDLGAVTSLYNKPKPYAKFLYREIAGLIQGAEATLVVVMPAGVGIAGHDAKAPGRRVAAAARPGLNATPTQLATAAVSQVEKIAAASGEPLPHVKAVAAPAAAPHHGHRVFLWLVIAGVLLAIALALLLRGRALQRAAAR